MEYLLEDISFKASEMGGQQVEIDEDYVNERLSAILENEDLSQYILYERGFASMKYVTISGKDFEEAVRKARDLYGSNLRSHHRRDITRRGGFFWLSKRNRVELTCYVVDPATSIIVEEEKIAPPVEVEEVVVEEEAAPSQQELL